ncbi:hypothetical protein SAY86_001636 [Trapa natans]|uniref:RING-type domain-containing protein n=1 Tax=Trapa natans TaxID=22666 RepID=A0AAN7LE85_TRANT|nr:hypothetical protein SAY86_001636 [Trapa natans]
MPLLPLLITVISFCTFLAPRPTSLWQTISTATPMSALLSYLSPITARMNWVLDVSLDLTFFGHSVVLPQLPMVSSLLAHHERSIAMASSYRNAAPAAGREDEECTICLSKMEDGEGIRELQCSHFFHGTCLDRWLGYSRLSCPLCRGSAAPRRTVSEPVQEVLVFKFSDFGSDSGGDKWWLR